MDCLRHWKAPANLPAHTTATLFGRDISSALPVCHSIRTCDIVSFFGGRRKTTPFHIALATSPEDISKRHVALFERFVIICYDRTSSLTSTKEKRKNCGKRKKKARAFLPGWHF